MIEISAKPHPAQKLVHDSPARFKVLVAGRRFGKTRLGVSECLDAASKGGCAWWVSPSYKMSEVGWRPLKRLGLAAGLEIRKVDRQVIFPNGGWVQVRSADNPESLRGEGLDFLVLDEASFIKEEALSDSLRPALTDKQGKVLFISTPCGLNWFYRLWLRGRRGEEGWESWQFPTSANPFIDPKEIEVAKNELPIRIFEQEYLGKFISDGTSVFRNLDSCLGAEPRDHRQGSYDYYFGVDLGRVSDFTAISVLEQKPSGEINQVFTERFNQIDYLFQLERLKVLNDKFRPKNILIERNSIGAPFLTLCEKERLPVEGFTTTHQSKKELIESLSLALEKNELRLIDDEIQLDELRSFAIERLPGGRIKYSAPAGCHDDTVIGLALSWLAIGGRNRVEFVTVEAPWGRR